MRREGEQSAGGASLSFFAAVGRGGGGSGACVPGRPRSASTCSGRTGLGERGQRGEGHGRGGEGSRAARCRAPIDTAAERRGGPGRRGAGRRHGGLAP